MVQTHTCMWYANQYTISKQAVERRKKTEEYA